MYIILFLFIDSLMIYITAFLKKVYKVNIYIYNTKCQKMFLVILPI